MDIGGKRISFRSAMIWLAVISLSLVCLGAGAETAEQEGLVVETILETVTGETDESSPVGQLTNDQLAAGYIQQIMSPGRKTLKSARPVGDGLTGNARRIYDFLNPKVLQVASGEITHTKFEISVDSIFDKKEFTAADLMLESLEIDGQLSDTAVDALYAYIGQATGKAVSAIKAEHPYEMYWFGNVYFYGTGYHYYPVDGITVEPYLEVSGKYTIQMCVAADYALESSYETYEDKKFYYDMDPKYGSGVQAAAQNAQSIVAEYEGWENYDRLLAYKNRICELTSYNHDAAGDESAAYGNPWQLIWVFDGNPDTKVVCEGYSKAFQYLNDQSNGSAEVISVSGYMGGGTGSGRHMWNIVTMEDGQNYLADITNSDEGSVGSQGNPLFLAGTPNGNGSQDAPYIFDVNGQSIYYVYGDNSFSAEELTIASAGYLENRPTLAAPNFTIDKDELGPDDCVLTVTITDAMPMDTKGNQIERGWFNVSVFKINDADSSETEIDTGIYLQREDREIMIPAYSLDGNGSYRLYVGANAEGCNGSSASREFTLADWDESTHPVKDFHVSKTEIETLENIYLSAYMSGAERYYVRFQRAEGSYSGSWPVEQQKVYETWNADREGRYTITVTGYGTSSDASGNQTVWEEEVGSALVTVTANGSLAPISLHNVPTVIKRTENLQLNGWFDEVGGADYYNVGIWYMPENSNGESLVSRHMRVGEDAIDTSLALSADQMARNGRYFINVSASARGYNTSSVGQSVLVLPASDTSIGLTANGGTEDIAGWPAQKEMRIKVNAPGACAVRLMNINGGWDYIDSRSIGTDGQFETRRRFEAGAFTLYAEACYDTNADGTPFDWNQVSIWDNGFAETLNWTNGSNLIQMEIVSSGPAAGPVIDLPGTVTRGSMLNVTLNSPGSVANRATRIESWISDQNENWVSNGYNREGILVSDYPITFQLPTAGFEAGTYQLTIRSLAEGYDVNEQLLSFKVEEPEGTDVFMFEVQEGDLVPWDFFTVSAYAPKASRMELIIQRNGDEEPLRYPFDNNYFQKTDAQVEEEGTYEIYAIAYYDDETVEPRQSETVRRTVKWLGKLDDPVIGGRNTFNTEEGLWFTVDGLDKGTWWWVNVVDIDVWETNEYGDNIPKNVKTWYTGDSIPETFTVSGDLLTAGHSYQISAGISRDGYQGGNSSKNVLVTGPASDKVTLSFVLEEGENLNHWLMNAPMHFRVSAPGSEAIRVWNGWDGWWYMDNQGMDENGVYEFQNSYEHEGEYTFLVQASYTTDHPEWGTEWGDFSWEDMEWTAVSNTVDVTMYALGTLDPADYTLAADTVAQGDPFEITINSQQGKDEYYGAWLLWEGGNSRQYWNNGTDKIYVGTAGIDAGSYELFVWVDAVGYHGTGVRVPVTLTETETGEIRVWLQKAEMQANETIQCSVYAPGAAKLSINIWQTNEDGSRTYETEDWNNEGSGTPDRMGPVGMYFNDPGVYSFQVTAQYADGTSRDSEIKTFTVYADGQLANAQVITGRWCVGDGIDLTVEPDGTTEWYMLRVECGGVTIHSPEQDNWRGGGTKHFSLDAGELAAGEPIYIQMDQHATGKTTRWNNWVIRPIDESGTLNLPANLERIEEEAFAGDNTITHARIPNGVRFIGTNAFMDCGGLLTVEIPAGVTGIQDGAFMQDNVTIYGYADSEAETYALNHGISFVRIQ